MRPDYATARATAGFAWYASGSPDALRALVGTPIRAFNLDPTACVETYRKGRPLFRELLGDDVPVPGVATPAVSYGHVNCLGSPLTFPEGGEVAHGHIYASLAEGIAALRTPVDFPAAGMAPFFLDFRRRLQEAFPGETVGFSFGLEGPVTTAWELRGEGFFTDLFDDPDGLREFMRLVVASILGYHRFRCAVMDWPVVNPDGGGMADDISSMVPPRLWGEFVLPCWETWYAGTTSGRRGAHVEDLRREHLPFLEEIGLASFDPSISPKLSPRTISEACRVPFGWRLGSFHYRDMTAGDVRDFVFQSAADGASYVSTCVAADMVAEPTLSKVRAFIEAGKDAKRLLDAGASRADLGKAVTPSGRARFLSMWPH